MKGFIKVTVIIPKTAARSPRTEEDVQGKPSYLRVEAVHMISEDCDTIPMAKCIAWTSSGSFSLAESAQEILEALERAEISA